MLGLQRTQNRSDHMAFASVFFISPLPDLRASASLAASMLA
jgi:hypothetical protein